ncbi:MAG: short-subunit dehydrogenase [bacterium]|jgi:short-subunit dehydrogenase
MKKIVLITGCSTGIGKSLALAFHQHGYLVYASARKLKDLDSLKEKGIQTLKLDVTSIKSRESAIQRIQEEQGRLDILINNAGYAAMGPLSDVPVKDLRAQFETNVIAPVALVQETISLLLRSSTATVINIGSVSGVLTTPFSGAYCATKSALHALSDAFRMELAPFGISVITVQPGAIQSNLGKTALAKTSIKEDSLFHNLVSSIQARANASQENPTSSTEFAEELIRAIQGNNPKPVIRIGKQSTLLPLLKRWVPTPILDQILSKKFKLNQILKG